MTLYLQTVLTDLSQTETAHPELFWIGLTLLTIALLLWARVYIGEVVWAKGTMSFYTHLETGIIVWATVGSAVSFASTLVGLAVMVVAVTLVYVTRVLGTIALRIYANSR